MHSTTRQRATVRARDTGSTYHSCGLDITVVTEVGMFTVLFSGRRDCVNPAVHDWPVASKHQGVATVQTKLFESPSVLPTLGALDEEFGCENEEFTAERRREGGAPMNATFRPTHSDFHTHLRAAPRATDSVKPSSDDAGIVRPSLARRVSRRLARLLVVLCVGIGSTLAWQSYGDAARAMIAKSSPQLGWLAPQTAPVLPTAPETAAPTSAVASDLEKLALGLAAVRQSVDQLTSQLAAGQQQMGVDIAKLQADEQEILHKLSVTAPRPTAAPAHKQAPVSAATPPPAPPQAR